MICKVLIRDFTPVVIMTWVVERCIYAEICIKVSHMISNDVDHDKNVPLMASIDKIYKILLGAEVIIKFVQISAPISMVSSIPIINDRRDPYSIEAHTLNIVKIVDDTFISSSTVVTYIISCIPRLSQP